MDTLVSAVCIVFNAYDGIRLSSSFAFDDDNFSISRILFVLMEIVIMKI